MIFFTDETMTVITDTGQNEFIEMDSPLGKQCLELYNKGQYAEINELIKQHKLVDNDKVKESADGNLLVEGVEMPVELANKVRECKTQNVPFDYLIKLAKKIKEIPSYNVRKQLYGFLSHNGHPITKDGNFVAYKKVNREYLDLHTKTIDNSIGKIVQMERSLVDDNPNNTCSSGLHVASFKYAEDFGNGRLVLCEVDPRNVVSVPVDYNQMKMRTCKYKVIGETKESLEGAIFDTANEGGDPWDIEENDQISFRGEGFKVHWFGHIDGGVVVDLISLETGQFAYENFDITNEYFTFR